MGNVVKEKSFAFAVRIVILYKLLCAEKNEFVLSKQLLRSGTAVGALVREAEQAESKADFVHKMAIALKEVSETEYCLELLHETQYLEPAAFSSIHHNVVELLKLLTSIIKMNYPAASCGVSSPVLARHSVLDTESSRVLWIPASAGMTNSWQAAGNEPSVDSSKREMSQ